MLSGIMEAFQTSQTTPWYFALYVFTVRPISELNTQKLQTIMPKFLHMEIKQLKNKGEIKKGIKTFLEIN